MKFQKILIVALFLLVGRSISFAQIAKIPIVFNGKHLYFHVKYNNSDSLNFIFDTGSTHALIDSVTVEKEGLSKSNRTTVVVGGSGGSRQQTMVSNQQLKFKGIELKDLNLILMNFSSLSKDLGSKVDGVIGYEILSKYTTILDFERKQMLLYDQIKSVDTTGYIGIPFEFSKNILIPRFPISITLANGESFTGKVMFDTGNAATLLVSTPFSKFHSFDSKLGETTITTGRGISVQTQDRQANIKAMSFNGFNFGPMGIGLSINSEAVPKDGYLGILGIDVIKRFHVILDYANHKIYLKKNNLFNEPFRLNDVKAKSKGLAKIKPIKGYNMTASGLQYKVIKKANGQKPSMESKVSLHYKVTAPDGKMVLSTYDDGKPWVHHLDKTLAGIREAVLMMEVGSKWSLNIPSYLAFGDSGYESVPPGSSVLCEVELLKVE